METLGPHMSPALVSSCWEGQGEEGATLSSREAGIPEGGVRGLDQNLEPTKTGRPGSSVQRISDVWSTEDNLAPKNQSSAQFLTRLTQSLTPQTGHR